MTFLALVRVPTNASLGAVVPMQMLANEAQAQAAAKGNNKGSQAGMLCPQNMLMFWFSLV
jgi:uncharacterized protein YccT (UPF0319 family)